MVYASPFERTEWPLRLLHIEWHERSAIPLLGQSEDKPEQEEVLEMALMSSAVRPVVCLLAWVSQGLVLVQLVWDVTAEMYVLAAVSSES